MNSQDVGEVNWRCCNCVNGIPTNNRKPITFSSRGYAENHQNQPNMIKNPFFRRHPPLALIKKLSITFTFHVLIFIAEEIFLMTKKKTDTQPAEDKEKLKGRQHEKTKNRIKSISRLEKVKKPV